MITTDFIDDENHTDSGQQEEIQKLLSFAYDYLKQEQDAEVSISFVGEEEIREINRNYRDRDQVTDVISFALEDEEDNLIHEDALRTLGDIIVCTKRAGEQASEYGHSYRRELLFLTLHGFLHLLGYDHMEDEDEREMNTLQDEILDAFGVSREV
ncbi:rRNA maturation RNase YbeY [Salinicoccus halodurans]|uniref:Endoribonuclease YbeY n=1 Tax=Salinicoccus halodurans TaxID=407035 RepID=A0A0F7HM71_9STAP|nr:rRNA maturation RNase YbeY [Salinicoccus halodurans]AKG73976.1 rRNA maturation factor [Salinicoccus halodurans]SFK58732.1 probable rRNA maturation factor [Salinicoccus halodurans]